MVTFLMDMDNCLADFDGGVETTLRTFYPHVGIVPRSRRTTFHPHDNYPEEVRPLITDIVNSRGFFSGLTPMPGAIEAFGVLASLPVDIFICTASVLTPYCESEKREWVEKYLGREVMKRIIFTPDKTLVRARYLVDDKPEITGSQTPSWEHVYYSWSYNQHMPGRRLTWSDYAWLVREIKNT